ncbi:MAG TPA: NEW3 domain-containing protein [Tepidisphaeraceae bacterium]|nr:NEW3 domain-containing protein [Tepidisphaeraceae bacterium]
MLAPVAGVCAGAAPASTQSDTNRVLRTFDFEERQLGNDEDLPMHWDKVDGPDLPHYVTGRLSTDRHRSGQYSFRMDLNGGSCVYRYDPGQIRVQRNAHYRVEGYCQTTALPNARARLTAYFTDLDHHPIASTVRHSELYAFHTSDTPGATDDEADWHPLHVELASDDPNAAYLVVEMSLLQPNMFSNSSLGQRSLFVQDIHGTAWFDDITISQVPQITISTDRPGNIFRRGEPLKLSVLVNDRFTDDLAAQLIVRDALGKSIFQRTGALDMSAAETLGPGQKRMSLLLPDVPPGWYQASLVMSSHGVFVGEQALNLVLLADTAPPIMPDPRFGVIATDLPFEGWSELPQILPFLSAGRVKLAVWSGAGDVQQMDSAAFDHLLESLQELGITPTACLISPPPKLVERLNGKTWLQLLKAPPEEWETQLAYLVSRHATHLDRWQLGADGSDEFVTNRDMRRVYSLVYQQFARLVQKPDLAMPWPAWYDLDGELPATVALSVPPSVLPAQLPLYMQDIKNHDGHNLSLTLQLLDRAQYGREMQIRDLAERVVYALAADAKRIDLPLPFTVRQQNEALVKDPQELLIIMRTLITTLGGSTFRGKVPIADNIEAFLFDKNGQGILVLWDKGNDAGDRQLALNLGDRPLRMDLWGNVTPLLHNGQGDSMRVKMNLGPMPIILIDIDGQIAQLRASVAFDQPLIESSFEPHLRHVRFNNPYHQAIGGTFKLRAPAGWTLNPPTFSFTLNPGETFNREVTIEFPYNSYAGAKTINAEFNVQAERNSTFTVPLTLTLGLSDVGMQSLALRDGKDVVVQQMITNYGEKPINYTAFAVYPGQARQERLVTNLGPGRTTMKKYRLTNVTIAKGAKVRAGVKELDGTRILNEEIEIQ